MDTIECISFGDLMDMEFPEVPERPMTAADVATMEDLTWTALVERQPLLAELAHRCASADSGMNEHFCANELWYNQFKPKLLELVGWEADTDDLVLRSHEAYELAYEHCYDLLPRCRTCQCL
jgi:hypothetical protein